MTQGATQGLKLFAALTLLSCAMTASQAFAGDECASRRKSGWTYYYDKECEKRISAGVTQPGVSDLILNLVFAKTKGRLVRNAPPIRVYFYPSTKLSEITVRLGGEILTQSKTGLGSYKNHEVNSPAGRLRLFQTLRRGGSVGAALVNASGRRATLTFNGKGFEQAYQALLRDAQ